MRETNPDEPNRAARAGDVLLIAGKGHFRTHELAAGSFVIGRDPACDVVFDDIAFSRRHATVTFGDGVLVVQDLGSTNGVRIGATTHRGGEPVTIALGDGFHIGPYSFLVVAGHADHQSSSRRSGIDRLRVEDPTIDGVPAFVRDVAATPTSVLILGESGSGKDVLAETLHVLSARSGELARVNCAALAEPLFESELFGHEKGAFTGAATAKVGLLESAQGGTVFLDEIGELAPATQAKLLRAIESREVLRIGSIRPIKIDVRFIAATNRDLPAEVAAKRFRHDLYFRLDGITLMIPALRDRKDRIPLLASKFVVAACERLGRPPAHLANEVFPALLAHDWPGNVRELKAVVERAILLARGGEIGVRHLAFSPAVAPPAAPSVDDSPERRALVEALDKCAGNQTRAAKLLGISRSTLINRLREFGIARPQK